MYCLEYKTLNNNDLFAINVVCYLDSQIIQASPQQVSKSRFTDEPFLDRVVAGSFRRRERKLCNNLCQVLWMVEFRPGDYCQLFTTPAKTLTVPQLTVYANTGYLLIFWGHF